MRHAKSVITILIALIVLTGALPAAGQTTPAGEVALSGANAVYGGRVYDPATNQTTYMYSVSGSGQWAAGSHFNVAIPACTPALLIVSTSPATGVSLGLDAATGVDGMQWALPLDASVPSAFSVSFMGNVAEGAVQVGVQSAGVEIGTLPGPSCITASVSVEKYVSGDGVTWSDSDDTPGLQVEPGTQVSFRFVISNVGNVELSNIALSDDLYDLSACAMPATLAVNSVAECTVGPFAATQGQHTNIATVTATYGSETVMGSDNANYFSGDLPSVEIDKQVAKNDQWRDSIRVRSGRDVSFKLIVTNTGNVTLSDLALTDSVYSTATCTLPAALTPGETFECIIGPFPAGAEDHTNTATVTATFGAQTVTDSDSASYTVTAADDDDDAPIIVIEGPIEEININIITIFDIDIEIDVNDPILRNIHVGDIIRVEGDMVGSGTTIVIVAVTIIIIDIDIVIIGNPSGPIFVPYGCKITGIGNNNPRLKCSNKGSSRKSS